MSPISDSRCPLDRGRFSHQPAVAVVLHKALSRLFPQEYRRRARETREEEEASKTRSQAVEEEEEEEEEGEEEEEKEEEEKRPSSSSLPSTPRGPLTPADFACSRPGCGRLLLDPVVLNCGHAVCGASGSGSGSGSAGGGSSSSSSCVPSGRACAACGGAGRVGGSAPRTCALLAGLIEALFPAQVAERREEARAAAAAAAATEKEGREGERALPSPSQQQEPTASLPLPLPQPQPQQRRPSSLDTHFGIGCDACGAYPLRGRRFRCLDCARSTAVGFDLCGDCFDAQREQQQAGEEGEKTGRGVGGVVDGRFAQVRLLFFGGFRERGERRERERERKTAKKKNRL